MRRDRYEIQHIVTAIVLAGVFLLNGQAAKQTYAQTKRSNSADSVQLYYFTSQACPPCRQVEPEMIRLYEAGYPVFKVDAHAKPQWTERFGVQRTPTTILVRDQEIVARHSGLIDARTVKGWFDSIGYAPSASSPNTPKSVPGRVVEIPVSTKGLTKTLHNGTDQPSTDYERVALQATVRLKVEDPEGTSFATGTVVHSIGGESLVLTCGHVFRESNGDGKIICEYGFADGQIQIADGELIYFDADDRDIGLVAIGPNVDIEPVSIARKGFDVRPGVDVFSIGCDQGDPPTIRHSRIKNLAKYSGVQKYDIFGRPVVGRSGGGLFTENGKLVGVCNAAVVDYDEGVYVGLDTVYWQISKVKLDHLFDGRGFKNNISAIAQNRNNAGAPREQAGELRPFKTAISVIEQFADDAIVRADVVPPPTAAFVRAADNVGSRQNNSNESGINTNLVSLGAEQHPLASGSNQPRSSLSVPENNSSSSGELIVIYRENESAPMTTWRIRNPKTNLLRELESHPGHNSTIDQQPNSSDANSPAGMMAARSKHAAERMATLRHLMPNVQPSENSPQYRAQSPR